MEAANLLESVGGAGGKVPRRNEDGFWCPAAAPARTGVTWRRRWFREGCEGRHARVARVGVDSMLPPASQQVIGGRRRLWVPGRSGRGLQLAAAKPAANTSRPTARARRRRPDWSSWTSRSRGWSRRDDVELLLKRNRTGGRGARPPTRSARVAPMSRRCPARTRRGQLRATERHNDAARSVLDRGGRPRSAGGTGAKETESRGKCVGPRPAGGVADGDARVGEQTGPVSGLSKEADEAAPGTGRRPAGWTGPPRRGHQRPGRRDAPSGAALEESERLETLHRRWATDEDQVLAQRCRKKTKEEGSRRRTQENADRDAAEKSAERGSPRTGGGRGRRGAETTWTRPRLDEERPEARKRERSLRQTVRRPAAIAPGGWAGRSRRRMGRPGVGTAAGRRVCPP